MRQRPTGAPRTSPLAPKARGPRVLHYSDLYSPWELFSPGKTHSTGGTITSQQSSAAQANRTASYSKPALPTAVLLGPALTGFTDPQNSNVVAVW